MILEDVGVSGQTVKVLLDGERQMKVFSKRELILLNDLVKVKSFTDHYGRNVTTNVTTNRTTNAIQNNA